MAFQYSLYNSYVIFWHMNANYFPYVLYKVYRYDPQILQILQLYDKKTPFCIMIMYKNRIMDIKLCSNINGLQNHFTRL